MSFASAQFAVFFAALYAAYWWLGLENRKRLLLVASYAFYALWDWRFVSLLVLGTLSDYAIGRRIANASHGRKSRWLAVSLSVNLGILGFFKYFDFFATNLVALSQLFGLHASPTLLRVALPIGISFYTFRSLSYTIDIHRGQLKPAQSLLDYAVFVAFFPFLGAGPIVRARQFLPQLTRDRRYNPADLETGFCRFVLGFCKKAFIADTIGIYLVDPVFARPGVYGPAVLWLALVGYSVQIYADFSGYSSMAIGVSRTLGFKVPENFEFPYLARSMSDFWRRWHISMTSWFRDYLWWSVASKIPFAAHLRWSAALVFVFLASGLWHGAGWTFVAWGGVHGIALAANQQWRAWRETGEPSNGSRSRWSVIPAIFGTNLLVSLGWLLFRAPGFGSAWVFLRGMFGGGGAASLELPAVVGLAAAGFVIDHVAGYVLERRPETVRQMSAPVRGLGYAALLVLLWHGLPEHAHQFIYFQF